MSTLGENGPSQAGGNLFVIAAPSGAGKTTLVKALLERDPELRLSVSYTTRPPRSSERDGIDYHFVTPERFTWLQEHGEFLEYALVHGNHYATSHTWLKEAIAKGHDVVLEIDWQGAMQVRRLIPPAVQIFILPPSMQALEQRLEQRGEDDSTVIASRLVAAREEIRHVSDFDYVIINHHFATAVDDLAAVARASRLRSAQQCLRQQTLISQLV